MTFYVFCSDQKRKKKRKYNQNFNVKFNLIVLVLFFCEPDM